eukprot:GSChrysophyteH1.ASY1.ANO1.793.1 assembled CDS
MSYQIRGRQGKGDSVADFLMPTNGIRGAQQRAGIKPKNHMFENRMALRFAQEKAREEREMKARGGRDLYKLEQFRDVAPRVYENTPASPRREGSTATSGNSNFLHKGTSDRRQQALKAKAIEARQIIQEKIEDARYIADRPNTPRKGATPKHDEFGVFKPRSHEDFIRVNRKAAEEMKAPATMTQRERNKQESSVHESFGKVPEYLQSRKAQMQRAKDEQARNAPDPNCPKGMKLMPEEERVQTLEVLKGSREEAINQLAKMPFVLETPTAKRKHAELEMKLKEIEAALALFSKQKVYIADR